MGNPTTKDKPSRLLTDKETFALDSFIVNGQADNAYLFSRPKPTTTTDEEIIHRMALRWLRQDEVKKYISDRRASMFGEISQRTENRTKGDIISELNSLASSTTDIKLKADLLSRIVDVEQMKKKEEDKEKEKQTTFYIPLKIDRCLDMFGVILAREFDWDEEQTERAIGLMRGGYDGRK